MAELQSYLEQIFEQRKKPLVVTMGNELKGDDAIGISIAEKLQSKIKPRFIMNVANVPANFIGKIAAMKPDLILFVDAIEAGIEPGKVVIYTRDHISKTSSFTTHYQESSLLLSFLEKETDELPDIYFVGIQVANTGLFKEMNSDVVLAGEEIVQILSKITILTQAD